MKSKVVLTLLLLASRIPIACADTPLLIFAGQSNMTGAQSDTRELSQTDLAEQPGVLFFYGKGWNTLDLGKRPTQPTQVFKAGFGFGPEAVVGKDLVAARVFPKVAEVKYILNGSPNASFLACAEDAAKTGYPTAVRFTWDPKKQTTADEISLYQLLLERVRVAQAVYRSQYGDDTYVAGFFWMQGESDAWTPALGKTYEKNLNAFIAALRADLQAPDMPFVYGRIRQSPPFPGSADVRTGEDHVADHNQPQFVPNVFEVDTDSFPMSPDHVHFSSAGSIALGHAMAKGFEVLFHAPK